MSPSSALQWLGNEGDESKALKQFLLQTMINRDLKVDISIDRALKEGWQKNAPTDADLEDLRRQMD